MTQFSTRDYSFWIWSKKLGTQSVKQNLFISGLSSQLNLLLALTEMNYKLHLSADDLFIEKLTLGKDDVQEPSKEKQVLLYHVCICEFTLPNCQVLPHLQTSILL